jgi:hypothetical protein
MSMASEKEKEELFLIIKLFLKEILLGDIE